MGLNEDIKAQVEARRKKNAEAAGQVEDWTPGPVAQNTSEADRNACLLNGRDPDGFRHRGNFEKGGELQFAGSLQDAFEELFAAHLWQGDYLDFGPEQVGGARFKDWASVTKEQNDIRGLVVRVAMLSGWIATSKELALAGFGAPALKAADEKFKKMTSADLWAFVLAQRAARTGGTASGGDVPETLPDAPGFSGGLKG